MTNKDQKRNLVEQDAFDRIHEVEKEQRRPYKKEKAPFPWAQVIMLGLLIIVLGTMVFTLF